MAMLKTLGLRPLGLAAALGLAALAGPAGAADLSAAAGPTAAYCRVAADSQLPFVENRAQLREEVTARYDRAVEVAATWSWIYSSRPVFTWASETELACGKAIGYLEGGTVDAENIGKCDCFYQRMISFMAR